MPTAPYPDPPPAPRPRKLGEWKLHFRAQRNRLEQALADAERDLASERRRPAWPGRDRYERTMAELIAGYRQDLPAARADAAAAETAFDVHVDPAWTPPCYGPDWTYDQFRAAMRAVQGAPA